MCGILGIAGRRIPENFKEINRSLAHRGPDDSAVYVDKEAGVALGHNRLSILDLSPNGAQPMISANGRFVITYNGEIYNYKEIRQELNKLAKINWKSTCDTEVLLEGFALLGERILDRLDGMFAFAIWDKQEHTLFLARDRMGIKPLYYEEDASSIAFCSELQPLSSELTGKREIDLLALNQFLELGHIPEPHTIYHSIKKFPAGSYGWYRNGNLTTHTYWNINEQINGDYISDERKVKEELKELLVKSVTNRLISDVPVGVFLSGGVDSSLIAAIVKDERPDATHTFSIGFENKNFDESRYAEEVARILHTEHTTRIKSQNELNAIWEKTTRMVGEPFADSSLFPTTLLSEMARKEVTVSLSGDGADELFMGYDTYDYARMLENGMVKKGAKFANSLFDNLLGESSKYTRFTDFDPERNLSIHLSNYQQSLLTESERRKILKYPYFQSFDLPELEAKSRSLTAREKHSLFDLVHYLRDDLLVKVDRASMAHGLEVRVPYLSHEVVEYAVNIDPSLKIRDGVHKYILKQILYDYLPKELFERKKWGFAVAPELLYEKTPNRKSNSIINHPNNGANLNYIQNYSLYQLELYVNDETSLFPSFRKTCPACGSLEWVLRSRFKNSYLALCKKCSHIFCTKVPSSQELDQFYSTCYDRNRSISPITLKRYEELLTEFGKHVPVKNVLDVGCGSGHFLDQAKAAGWSYAGVELSEDAVEFCQSKGLENIHCGDLPDLALQKGTFGLIVMLEVIEHLTEPAKYIKAASELLAPGGLLYLTTPNFDSLSRHSLGSNWSVINYPEHLSYFNPSSMDFLMGRFGLEKSFLKTQGLSPARIVQSMSKSKIRTNDRSPSSADYVPQERDERIRQFTDNTVWGKGSKKMVNTILSSVNLGDTIKALYVKRP